MCQRSAMRKKRSPYGIICFVIYSFNPYNKRQKSVKNYFYKQRDSERIFYGSYLNPKRMTFQGSLRSQIYIDKSGLIGKMNALLGTEAEICLRQPSKTIWKVYGGKYAECIL